MKKISKRLLTVCICIAMLTTSFLSPVTLAASGVYELTFDNLFVFEQWANHANLKVNNIGDDSIGTLETNIEEGSFVLTNKTSDTEVFTTFSMSTSGSVYSMSVKPSTEYVFSYETGGTATSFESFVFYFDSTGTYTSLDNRQTTKKGLHEWSFTTPENAAFINVRFDNNTPSTYATYSSIRIRERVAYDFSKGSAFRKVFTHSAGTSYGELPAPERDNLVFAGWFTGPDGTGKKISSNSLTSPTSLCLYSKWDPIVDETLEIISLPEKADYCVGEKLNTKGLVIGVTYPDGSKENIDEGFYCSPEILTEAGTQTILVTYSKGSAEFTVNVKSNESKTFLLNDSQKTVNAANHVYTLNYSGSAFNQYKMTYSSDAYVKGEFNFNGTTEEFFLEPAENGDFSSYIDGFLDGKTQTKITSVSFTPLDKDYMSFTLTALDLIKSAIPEEDENGVIPLSNSDYKIGIDLKWGGALTYLEDTKNSIVSAKNNQDASAPTEVGYSSDYNGTYTSGCDTLNQYETSEHVNLINANDTGRLVQQSYYGTGSYPYEPGVYDTAIWNYNPVQGGNQYNEPSKIVDLKVTTNEIYIKCQPLDWAKEAEYITPSYMEAWYTLEDGVMRATCRFVDFSGYPSVTTTQELPAFYCVEPLNNFIYYTGGEAWSDSNTQVSKPDLGFWGTTTEQDFICNENWGAFVGSGKSDYGIGIYTPGQTLFHTGVFYGGDGQTRCSTLDPATESPTSYIGVVDSLYFQSYTPISYCYYITTGNVGEIRESFKEIAQAEEDFCNGTYTNGFCDMCGRYEKATLTTDKYDIDLNGTVDAVYEISNAGQLLSFRDLVNNGNTSANAVLTDDIVFNESLLGEDGIPVPSSIVNKWTPIGTALTPYNGIFDGKGHVISGLYFNDTTAQSAGLFGYTTSSAMVGLFGITDSYFSADTYAGGICGNNAGLILNAYCTRSVINANTYAGGITGANSGTIQTNYSTASVSGNTNVGAISGSNTNTVNNSYYLESSAITLDGTVQNGIGSSSDNPSQTTAKALEEFHSGEVAYLLQKYNSDQVWGQRSNVENSAPVIDYTGQYKVNMIGTADNYSVVYVGDAQNDGVVDIYDYQQIVNLAISDTPQPEGHLELIRSDLNGDGVIDVLDCSIMALLINGLRDGISIHPAGDYDCDGITFTDADVTAIKKALINQNGLSTWQKYACDINLDGKLNVNDKTALEDTVASTIKPIYIDMTTTIVNKSKTANVLILCGQSNAYGASPLTNAVKSAVSGTDFSNVKIKYNNINSDDGQSNWKTRFSNESFETFRLGIGGQAEQWFGPEVGLSYFLATNEETKDELWYIIKYTAAGTYLGGNWLYDAGYNNAVNAQNIYDDLGGYLADNMVTYVNEALDELSFTHSADKINIRAFMWHQGESDSCVKEWADQYGDLQRMLVSKVRTSFEKRDADTSIGFVDGGIAAYDSRTFFNPNLNAEQPYTSWVYSDTVNTHKTNMASLWYVPVATSKNIINKTSAGLYTNTKSTKLANSIWVDTSTCVSKYANNNENGEYDGSHYCGDSMLKLGQWYGYAMTQVGNL